eukprot:scaffold119791_cov37-Phaeocystis_antarctica.AAC.1
MEARERGAHLDASEELRADAEVVRDKVEECVAARGRRLPQEVEDEERGQPDLPLRHCLPQQAALRIGLGLGVGVGLGVGLRHAAVRSHLRARVPDKLLQRPAARDFFSYDGLLVELQRYDRHEQRQQRGDAEDLVRGRVRVRVRARVRVGVRVSGSSA